MAKETNKIRTAIIGGGASGLAAAIFASGTGNCSVTVFEAKDVPGRKINGTGNGKCNFTNDRMGIEYYRGEDPSFAKFALQTFDNECAKLFFRSIGILPKEKNGGYIYPNSEEASSVSAALTLTAKSLGAVFEFQKIKSLAKAGKNFIINNQTYDKVILACGSIANMKDVTDFNGYDLARSLGHKITPLYPSLCQIRCEGNFFKTINGVRTEASIKLLSEGRTVAAEEGELLFTDYGVSGIPAFQISRFCASERAKKHKVELVIDLLPGLSAEEAKAEVTERIKAMKKNKRTTEEALFGLLNHKLNFCLLNMAGIDPAGNGRDINDEKLKKLVSLYKSLTLKVTGTNDFSYAQVTAGGVDTKEIDPETMESRITQGLYFAGEIIDIDGTCGGYNLQWAWSTGFVSGLASSGVPIPADAKTYINRMFG